MYTSSNRWRQCLRIVLSLCFASLVVQAHAAERRVALVIGNSAYAEKPLRNPVNDATDMATALRRMGFEVMERKNRNADQLRGDLSDFQDKLNPGAVGLFYFAGHGVQAGRGQNYLLPVGVTYKRERDAEAYGLEVGSVLRRMEDSGASLSLVILDACRDSPLPPEGRSTGSRGLGRMEAPSGSMIAFATAPGSIADDNSTGRNGLYTQHLLAAIETPGMRLEDVFKRVRRSVERDSNRRQSPEEIMKLTSDEPFYFKGGPGVQTASLRPELTGRLPQHNPEEDAWAAAKAANSSAGYGAYLDEYPNGRFASAARVARASLAGALVQHESSAGAAQSPGRELITVRVDGREFRAVPSEKLDYEAVLMVFRKGEFADAQGMFVDFLKRYPQTGYRPTALFWLGNAQYATKDYKDAITSFLGMVAAAPDHARAPEAGLAIANCQLFLKDISAARKTLEEVIASYPASEAAGAARERLARLK